MVFLCKEKSKPSRKWWKSFAEDQVVIYSAIGMPCARKKGPVSLRCQAKSEKSDKNGLRFRNYCWYPCRLSSIERASNCKRIPNERWMYRTSSELSFPKFLFWASLISPWKFQSRNKLLLTAMTPWLAKCRADSFQLAWYHFELYSHGIWVHPTTFQGFREKVCD